MKKLLAVLICTAGLIGSAFAVDFSIGARGFLGTDFDANSSFAAQGTTINTESQLNFGFGAYTNLTLFGGLGIQAETNLTRGKTTLSALNKSEDLEIWTLDIPLMVWLKSDIGKHFQVGLGAGPNFAFNIPAGNFKSVFEQTASDISNSIFTMGICVGADVKFFFNDHIGLVFGGRYVTDLKQNNVPITVAGQNAGSYPTVDVSRKSLYGNIGVEFKFF